jgi:hypothetical protein
LLTFRFSQSIRFAGAKREGMLDAVKSNGVDILITSYHTIVSDFKKYLDTKDAEKKQGSRTKKQKTSTSIFDLVFHRIVLDEAHMWVQYRRIIYLALFDMDACLLLIHSTNHFTCFKLFHSASAIPRLVSSRPLRNCMLTASFASPERRLSTNLMTFILYFHSWVSSLYATRMSSRKL